MLPAHPHPKCDELLSSWITRVAHHNQFKVHSFCVLYYGKNRNVWNRDIDKLGPDWLVEGMASLTGTPIPTARSTTLRSYESIVFERLNPNGNTKWIMPLGIYHRTHRRFGLQYCPICLAMDEEPYFRKQWRLAFYTVCETHHTLLRDSCPECDRPIVFYRGDVGYKTQFEALPIRHCNFCGTDLTCAPSELLQCTEWTADLIFRNLLDLHWLGWSCPPLPMTTHSHLLWEGIHQLCKTLLHAKGAQSPLIHKIEEINGLQPTALDWNFCFEWLRVKERHRLMLAIAWLLADWPQRMLNLCRSQHVVVSTLFKDMLEIPYWYRTAFLMNATQPINS